MEPLSAGASVLAFVGTALESTKGLYNVVSSFKTANREITSLVSAVRDLQFVLTQLQQCRALRETAVDLQDTRKLLEECNKDVANFEQELRKVEMGSKTAKLQQVWKRMRTTIAEKSFERMWTKLHHHFDVITIQLNLLQRYANNPLTNTGALLTAHQRCNRRMQNPNP